jgi:hypothetical protein
MSVPLTPEQQQALDAAGRGRPRLVDPRTNAAYILLPEAEYETIKELIEEERQQQAIHAAALRNAVGRMDEAP